MQPSEPRPGPFGSAGGPPDPTAAGATAATTAATTAGATGGSAVRRSMQQLDALATLPLDEHAVVYQQVHEDLQRALADIDDA